MAISVQLPKDGEGFEAEVNIQGFHVVLRAVHTGYGPVAQVYDAQTKKWRVPPEFAGDLDDAKARADAIARGLYTIAPPPKGQFPQTLDWHKTGG